MMGTVVAHVAMLLFAVLLLAGEALGVWWGKPAPWAPALAGYGFFVWLLALSLGLQLGIYFDGV